MSPRTRVGRLTAASWRHALLRMWRGFFDHQCFDQAAALTFFSLTGTLPLLIALVSILGLVGQAQTTVDAALATAESVLPVELVAYLEAPVRQVMDAPSAGFFLGVSVVSSLVTASAWVRALARAINRIYEMPELRPPWLLWPQMILVTLVLVVLLAVAALTLLASPAVLTWLGERLGWSDALQETWSTVRLPLLGVVAVVAVTLLFYATPNVRQPGLRRTWPGAALAIALSAASVRLFLTWTGAFVGESFNRTYGALATPLVIVLCIFLTNLAIILGAELNAGLERARELQGGVDAVGRIQLPPKSTRDAHRLARLRSQDADSARALLLSSGRTSDAEDAARRPVERRPEGGSVSVSIELD